MVGLGLRFVCAVFFILVLFPVSGLGDDLDDILSGFDEMEELGGFSGEDEPDQDDVLSPEAATLPSWLDLSGSISLATALNFNHEAPEPGQVDHRDFSKLKLAADVTADIKINPAWQARLQVKGFYDLIYDLKGRDEYPKPFLDDYQKELELGEAWIQGSFVNLDIKVGRQIVVWGKSDNIRITDILNPLDNREPGLVDIEDLRLPVAMTKVDYYRGSWNVSAMVLHEVRLPKNPVYGSDFFPGSAPLPRQDKPGTAWRNQEFALAANGVFSGWDLSFYGATLFNDLTHVAQTANGVKRQHSRLKMAGSALNVALGNWLVKGEFALLDGLEYSIPTMEDKTRMDTLIGLEYSGIDETMLSFELANRHIFAFDSRLKQAPYYEHQDDVQTVFRLNRDFYNDTLQLTCLLSFFGLSGNNGSFQRFSLEYEMTANSNITAGFMTYQSGDKASFRDIGDNDRVFLEMRSYF